MTTKQILISAIHGCGREGYRKPSGPERRAVARAQRIAAQAVKWSGGGHRVGDVLPPRGSLKAYHRLFGRIG